MFQLLFFSVIQEGFVFVCYQVRFQTEVFFFVLFCFGGGGGGGGRGIFTNILLNISDCSFCCLEKPVFMYVWKAF